MRKKIQRLVLLSAVGLLILPSIITLVAPSQTAHAAEASPLDQLEKWLYYRGMRACLDNPDFAPNTPVDDNGDRSRDDINSGHWLPGDSFGGGQPKKGFGYLAGGSDGIDGGNDNDGTVNCTDGSIFVRGATLFGFASPVDLLCEINRRLEDIGAGGRISPNGDDCEKSTKFHFDGGGGSWFQQGLTKALESGGDKDRPPFDINDNNGPDYSYKALLYLIGKRSLETFCGDGVPLENGLDDLTNDDNRVSVHIVQPDGTILKSSETGKYYILKGDRTQGSKVDDVYYNHNGDDNNAQDLKCQDMAQMTRDNAQAYADWAVKHGDLAEQIDQDSQSESEDPSGSSDGTTQCNIPKTGWILCPVLDTMANVADQAFGFLSDNFLAVDAKLFDTSGGTYAAWKTFRDIANVAFVIAVMVVVYSQLTGAGISNYGIKKLLPKIVVAAILVNLSYFICQLAVDVSNILGYTLRDFFNGIGGNIKLPAGSLPDGDVDKGVLDWVGIVGTVVVGAALVWLFLGALIPIMLAALVAMFMILFILLARKALIVLLIALAPLAFVAYLLPNTEQWYKKWQKTFVQLLMVFPIIAVVFGASGLASSIVASSGGDTMIKIIAAGIAVIPLFVVPSLLKRSVDAAGSIGAKLNGIGDKAGGYLGKKGSERVDRSALMRGRQLRSQAKQQYRDRKFAQGVSGADTSLLGRARRKAAMGVQSLPGTRPMTDSSAFAQEQLGASANAAVLEQEKKDVSAQAYQLTQDGIASGSPVAHIRKQYEEALKSGNQTKAKAAFTALRNQGDDGVSAIQQATQAAVDSGEGKINTDTNFASNFKQFVSSEHNDIKGTDARITNWAGTDGSKPAAEQQAAIGQVNFSGLSDQQIATQTKDALETAAVNRESNFVARQGAVRQSIDAGTISTKAGKSKFF